MTDEATPRLEPGTIKSLVEMYLPSFRQLRGKPVEYVGGGTEPDGTIRLAYPTTDASVYAFVAACQKRKVIYSFDWPSFARRAEELVAPGGIEAAELEDLRRLLTVIIRQDRFGPGVVEEMVENGVFVRILERMSALTGDVAESR